LAHLLYKKFINNIDKPKKVLGFDENGELEQGPHGLSLALTLPVVFSFEDSGVPPDVVLLEAVVSPSLHSGMVKPFPLGICK
jgi:hypothetical protein